ncbi:ACP S-malonyltransferase [Serpentinicella sp. ANB-PHB4]|uniref:ACP S-malonyltransferase n=1 Tax=Serpentinicella sp. ANB-PHB4 TaxID=3074076 RepID=UPI00285EC2BA|nr:ACP S-malonyltransferase [Serpentinicella sp. ANB-PHB4]MDR5658296.1 ACP S-malonyltransferase [Serpentinicella sp. ANB-PHB4]
MRNIAFVFPGQGAQYTGMGKEIATNFTEAKDVYDEASEQLGFDMAKLCFEDPDNKLIKTENTQPAILTTSIAILRVLEKEGIVGKMAAGLSLGEYSALVSANALAFKDAVKLVKKRGKYMQETVPQGAGAMAAILGQDKNRLISCLEECRKHGVVEVANYNSPGQIVISGEVNAVKAAIEITKNAGAKKAVMLPVSAPFHCSLLKEAGDKLLNELEKIKIQDPIVPVVTNVNAKKLLNREEIIPNLVKQISHSVLWHDVIILMMKEGFDTFVEIGPGKTLSNFIKKIAKFEGASVETLNVDNLSDLQITVQKLRGGLKWT